MVCQAVYAPGYADAEIEETMSPVAREPEEEGPRRTTSGAPRPSDGTVLEVEPRPEQAIADGVHLLNNICT